MIFDHIIVGEREKGRHLEPRARLITLVSVELICLTKEIYKSFFLQPSHGLFLYQYTDACPWWIPAFKTIV